MHEYVGISCEQPTRHYSAYRSAKGSLTLAACMLLAGTHASVHVRCAHSWDVGVAFVGAEVRLWLGEIDVAIDESFKASAFE